MYKEGNHIKMCIIQRLTISTWIFFIWILCCYLGWSPEKCDYSFCSRLAVWLDNCDQSGTQIFWVGPLLRLRLMCPGLAGTGSRPYPIYLEEPELCETRLCSFEKTSNNIQRCVVWSTIMCLHLLGLWSFGRLCLPANVYKSKLIGSLFCTVSREWGSVLRWCLLWRIMSGSALLRRAQFEVHKIASCRGFPVETPSTVKLFLITVPRCVSESWWHSAAPCFASIGSSRWIPQQLGN